MDLNYLLARHQTSLARVATATCPSSRTSHQGLADLYAAEVNAIYRLAGASARLATQVAA